MTPPLHLQFCLCLYPNYRSIFLSSPFLSHIFLHRSDAHYPHCEANFQFLAFKEAFKPISIPTVPIYTSIYSGQLFLLSPYPFQCLLLFGSFVSMIAILTGMRQNFNVALIYIYLMVNDVEYFKNVISHSYFFFENSVQFHGQFLLCFLFS